VRKLPEIRELGQLGQLGQLGALSLPSKAQEWGYESRLSSLEKSLEPWSEPTRGASPMPYAFPFALECLFNLSRIVGRSLDVFGFHRFHWFHRF
jgi:hypothetical protein